MRVIFAILLVNTCICGSAWAINDSTPNLSFEAGAASFPTTFSDDDLGVWKRYYGFYGAENFDATQIVNRISNFHCYAGRTTGQPGDEDNDGWVRYGTQLRYDLPDNRGNYPRTGYYTIANGLQGTFEIITNRTLDPSVLNQNMYRHWNASNCKETWNTTQNGSTEMVNCPEEVPFYTMPQKLETGQNVVRIGSTGGTEVLYSSYEPRGYYRRAHAERMVYSFKVC